MARKAKVELPPENPHPCAVEGCPNPGEHKAPLSRSTSGEYQWMCLEHIRKFNETWDYFKGWSREEIERFSHEAAVHGNKPTWRIGSQPTFTPEKLREALYRMMGEKPPKKTQSPAVSRKVREAFATLDLDAETGISALKAQYKKLVKKYHPDVNKTKDAEETFKRITAAYNFLIKQNNDEKR